MRCKQTKCFFVCVNIIEFADLLIIIFSFSEKIIKRRFKKMKKIFSGVVFGGVS